MSEVTRWGDVLVRGTARRQEIRRRHGNGLDTVEVDRNGCRLQLTFLEHAPADVQPGNIRVDGPSGAAAVRALRVRRAAEDDPHLEDRLLVELAAPGGAGRYTVALVEPLADGRPGWAPLRGLDPRFAQAAFSFDVDLPNPVAGAARGVPAAAGLQASYLARDYEGLRQLILDRLAQTMPAWTESHVPDIGITLVELLAYVGDDLSYYQDAVATEGYLQTARRRISVRRHARLVDYRLAEGSQARAWVCLAVTEAVELPLRELVFAVAPSVPPGRSPVLPAADLLPGAAAAARWYTPVRAAVGPPGPMGGDGRGRGPTITASPAHNEIGLWAWGEPDGWLRAGATTAVLMDGWTDHADHGPAGPRALTLQAGDVAVLEATRDPDGTGPPDPTRRHPVRLTAVHPSVDRLYDQALLEVTWAPEAALPFDLQISAPGPDGLAVPCAVVRANTVLVGDGAVVTEQLAAGQLALTRPALTWGCPFPDPAVVARHQGRLLRRLPADWRREVEGWRRDAEGGQALDEHRLSRLRALLGEDVLTEFGLGDRPRDRARHEAAGLRRLLLDASRLLAPRLRRLAVLAALARASGPLDEVLLREVADDWGAELARLLSAHQAAAWGTADAATSQDASQALPLLRLVPAAGTAGAAGAAGAAGGQQPWTMVADVVDSPPGSRRAMVEVDDAGLGHLRFSPGDQPAGPVQATYQAGQGSAGNVPARAINAVAALTPGAAAALTAVQSLGNPLPATGGTDPESVIAARAALPGAFRLDQPRALTAADYTAIAERVPGVRRAATVLRWTGTRYAADVAVQPTVGEDPSQQLLAAVDDALWPVRRIGHELWVRPPSYRPLVLGLSVDLGAAAVRADVSAALTALLGAGTQADGTPGLFSPRRLGFGQPVYASPIVAAAQDVPGVEAVVLSRFGFLGPPGAPAPARPPGQLRVRAGEIARLDNDPDVPEHGYVVLNLRGGR
jgi:predicted phage baseplate assembly protein